MRKPLFKLQNLGEELNFKIAKREMMAFCRKIRSSLLNAFILCYQ